MSNYDALVAAADYLGTQNTQIANCASQKWKGSSSSARALNLKVLVPDMLGSKQHKQENEKERRNERAGLSQISRDLNSTRKKAMVAQIKKEVGPR